MSLSIFSLIYDSMVSFLGATWIAWVTLLIFVLIVFSTILRVPYMIVLSLATLPFIILGIYSAIQVGTWVMFLALFLMGLILAISIYKLMTR